MQQRAIALLVALGLLGASPGIAVEIVDPGQGAFELDRGRSGAFGLSGITHVEGNLYYAVSDQMRRLFALEIRIDPLTGRIVEARIEKMPRLAAAQDSEAISIAGPASVWISDEVGPAVREHSIEDGSVIRTLQLPPIFAQARRNLSLEALTLDESGAIWIANEEALTVDGPESSEHSGTLVRLQRFESAVFDPAVRLPAGQWAYRTDPIPGRPMRKFAASGVVELASVSEDLLLVLERGFGSEGIRSRIYSVDWSHATETSSHPELLKREIEPVEKRLLWEGIALGDNFEGMTLGPPLANGDNSLILISDDGGATQPRLYPLRIRTREISLPAPTPVAPPAGKRFRLPITAGIAAALLGAWVLRSRLARQRESG